MSDAPKRGRGRPKGSLVITADLRKQVETYVSFGIPQAIFCKHLGISPRTLQRHFKKELETAEQLMIATLGSTAYRVAMGHPASYDAQGNKVRSEQRPNVDMLKFLLLTRGKWRISDPKPDNMSPASGVEKVQIEVIGGFRQPDAD